MGEVDRTRTRNVADLTHKKVPEILTMFKEMQSVDLQKSQLWKFKQYQI